MNNLFKLLVAPQKLRFDMRKSGDGGSFRRIHQIPCWSQDYQRRLEFGGKRDIWLDCDDFISKGLGIMTKKLEEVEKRRAWRLHDDFC